MLFIVEKPRRIDQETKIPQIRGKRSGGFKTRLVQKVDCRRRMATECNDMLEPIRGPDGLDQCRADAAAGAEDNRHARLGKRPKINSGGSRARWRHMLGH